MARLTNLLQQDRELLSHLWRWSGLAWLVRRTVARSRVSIVVYHDPPLEYVERHLKWLSRHYSFVTLDEVADAIQNGIWANLPRYPLVVTLDDGHRGNRELTEAFRRHGVRPTVYACSAVINGDGRYWFRELDRPTRERLKRLPHRERIAATAALPPGPRHALTPAELRDMAAVFDIGSHTRTHPVLTTCGPDENVEEIEVSKAEIEATTGRQCRHFCFPNGDHLPLTETLAARAGYSSARTMDFGWNSKRTPPYRLRVLAAQDRISVTRLCADLAGASIIAGWFKGRRAGRKRPIVAREDGAQTSTAIPAANHA